ncbi:hypothetical protein DF186_24095, partial [Enterococcus hirae]
ARNLPLHTTKTFIKKTKQKFDRIKNLKKKLEIKITKLKKDLKNEETNSQSLTASLKLTKNTVLIHKNNYITSYRKILRL